MGALKQQNLVSEVEIIENVLFECGFIHLSDKKVFIFQLQSGEYIRINSGTHNNIKGLLKIFGGASFDLLATPENKAVSARIANRLLQKYNEISE